jgi:membrane-associated phospholipid phosphatase
VDGSALNLPQGSQPNVIWRIDAAAQRAARDSTRQESQALQTVARGANWWGGDGVVYLAALLWLGGRVIGRHTVARIGLRGAEALAIASALSGILKGLAGRARPFLTPGEPWHFDFNHGWSDARYFSMPSGHTTATVAFAVGVALALGALRPANRLWVAVPLLASALVVAWGRVFTNQHWLSDVTVALLLGSTTSLILARLHRRGPAARYHRVMLGKAPVA